MSKPNVRLTEADVKIIEAVKKRMEKEGFVRPSTADAVRYGLRKASQDGWSSGPAISKPRVLRNVPKLLRSGPG